MTAALRFSLRSLRRDWRAGELRVLALALAVAVAAVTAVGLFTDRVERALLAQAGEFLAADLVVGSPRPIPAALIAQAEAQGLAHAQAVEFRSVVVGAQGIQLAEAKAVDGGYPLRGTLRLAAAPFGPERAAEGAPAPGHAWADARLMQALGLAVGDRVELGEQALTIEAVLAHEPDRAGELFSIAPRLMFNRADLDATGLIQTGSLVQYRLLLAGPADAVAAYRDWVEPRLHEADRLQGVREARPELEAAMGRAEQFLGLAALVAVVLAGAAIALAVRRYSERNLDASAVMRCLGARQGFIARVFLLQLLWLGLAACAVGVLLAFGAQALLAHIAAGLVAADLPAPGIVPALVGLGTGLVTLAGFAFPPVLALRRVPPARVLRQDVGGLPLGAGLVYGAAAGALLVLMAWQTRDLQLTLYVAAGTVAALVLLGAGAAALVALVRPLGQRLPGVWRFGLANIGRRRQASALQIAALGLGAMVLLLLTVVREDLLAEWQARVPPGAPNHFLINVQADQVDPLQDFLAEEGLRAPHFYPMVRGRLVAQNGAPVREEDFEEPRARRLVQREFNLSWAAELPPDNRVLAGRWWMLEETHDDRVSVEEGLAETLNISLGDRLEFQIGAERVAVTVASLRSVEWDSFRPNFFVLAPPGLLDEHPASYITSFYLPRERQAVLNALSRQFPNVTVLDVDAIMTHVRGIMERVARAVQFVFAFTLGTGLLVLLAAVQATHEERRREAALLRALGARRPQVWAAYATEFAALGLLAGALGGLAAAGIGYVFAQHLFDLPYQFTLWPALLGGVLGAAGAAAAGLWAVRGVLAHSPLTVLRAG
ncbi:FtsX-like permease family protein [Ectothiorhodospiraceae bacterium 2226]|nr:FtsX-like permease family protein [Ectothiorhodospiraceae bacterium 2226]